MPKKEDSQPATKADLQKLVGDVDKRSVATDKRFTSIDHRLDGIDKKIETLQHNILDLTLDAKEAKEERGTILQELKLLNKSIMRLDDRVRYQQDLPERVKQLEQDVYDLKRKIHNKAQVP